MYAYFEFLKLLLTIWSCFQGLEHTCSIVFQNSLLLKKMTSLVCKCYIIENQFILWPHLGKFNHKRCALILFFSKSDGSSVPLGKQKKNGDSFSLLYKNNSQASVGDMEIFSDYVTDLGPAVDKTEFSIQATVSPGKLEYV